MKGQTLIIQFILFFLIGFSLFASIAFFFKYQSNLFKDDIIKYNLKLINGYMSVVALTEAVSCKQCDYANIVAILPSTAAGSFFEIGMNTTFGLNTSVPMSQDVTTSIYNLNSSYTLSGTSASTKPISITFIKAQNYLGVS